MTPKFFFPFNNKLDFLNIEKIRQLKNCKIVYFFPEEHSKIIEDEQNIKIIEEILTNNNSHLEIWLGNYEDNDRRLKNLDVSSNLISIINWPYYLLKKTYNNFLTHCSKKENIKYLFLCLNRRQSLHKCILIDEIFKRNLQKYGKISWLKRDHCFNEYNFQYFDDSHLIIDSNYQLQMFEKNRNILYKDVLVDLVAETSIDVKDISEKTWFSILYKNVPLILGHQGIYEKLTSFGIQTHSFFDYSFDQETDLNTKINLILGNIENIINCDIQEMYLESQKILDQNYQVVEDLAKADSNIPKKLKEYRKKYSNKYHLLDYYYRVGKGIDV